MPPGAVRALRSGTHQRRLLRAEGHHPVDQGQRLLEPVLDQHHGRVDVVEGLAERRAYQLRTLRIEVRGRLVEQQQPRLQRDHAGDREPLLLAAGQRGRVDGPGRYGKPTAARAASTRGQISARGTPRFSRPNATSSPQRAHHQLGLRVLEHDARVRPVLPGGPAVDEDRALLLAGVLGEQAGERGEQGALAGAGGTREQHPLAVFDPQVEVGGPPRPCARRAATRNP